jgi:hypothetical protein
MPKRNIPPRRGKTPRYSFESAVRGSDAKCRVVGPIFLFHITNTRIEHEIFKLGKHKVSSKLNFIFVKKNKKFFSFQFHHLLLAHTICPS